MVFVSVFVSLLLFFRLRILLNLRILLSLRIGVLRSLFIWCMLIGCGRSHLPQHLLLEDGPLLHEICLLVLYADLDCLLTLHEDLVLFDCCRL